MSEMKTYDHFYNADDPQRWGRAEMPKERAITRSWLHKVGVASCVVLELGCGKGSLQDVHSNYVGLDLSLPALQSFATKCKRINGDMQLLPLRDNTVDFVFSWAALEHVPNPEKVLLEVERILVGGGTLLLAPAWNVRSWAAKALPIRSYRELSWADRIRKASIPLRNSLVWRGLFTLPVRLYREFRLLFRKPLEFNYRRLSPNLSEYIYTDCDAFTSMDPHAGIMYFLTRGWTILSHPTFRSRMLARHEPVLVRKPFAAGNYQEGGNQ